MAFKSSKLFSGYSVALRQHKAQHSHCQLLHGYALEFYIEFEPIPKFEKNASEPSGWEEMPGELDEMNWVVDFGGFKRNGLKEWMDSMFDHTVLIEKDDPYLDYFLGMNGEGIAKVIPLDMMGAEALAKLVYDKFNDVLSKTDGGRCRVIKVECRENKNNKGIYTR